MLNVNKTNKKIRIKKRISLVENQNDLELDFKGFLGVLLILVVQILYLMNPTDATLASLSILKY